VPAAFCRLPQVNRTARKDLLNDAYKKASERKDIGTIAHDVWESLQTLSRLIKAAASGEYTGIPTPTVVGGVAVLLYFLSPIDFVPDFIPIIGLLDDAALLAWFMTSIKTEMDKFEEWEKSRVAVTIQTNAMSSNQPVDTSANIPKYRADDTNLSPEAQAVRSSLVTRYVDEPTEQSESRPQGNSQGTGDQVHLPSLPRNEDGSLKNDAEKLGTKAFAAHDLITESNAPDDVAVRSTASSTGEPNGRSATTNDSTRLPNHDDNDRQTGGNVR
jgi:uncharacterized membrane protein YkvA (DUF1232 family)